MNLILNNPYRVTGMLVGATAREQERQIRRLRQYIEAEQEPENDFSFPALGELNRSLDNLNDAVSKLNLDSDKMSAALFWFYSGNSIIDEPAFEELNDGNLNKAESIWKKLTYNSDGEIVEVTKRNASAFQNLSTLFLNQYKIDDESLQLKLLLLESDFFIDLKNKATDGTYNISKKELQILFLNSLLHDDSVEMSDMIDALTNIEFLAKDDFLKSFVQKPIDEIEKYIENAKSQRKANKSDGVYIGNSLYDKTFDKLNELELILGDTNIKFASIADKVAHEVLQCSIDFFNYCQENESYDNYIDQACNLANKAEIIAKGKVTKDRILDTLETINGMRDQEISQAITLLQSIKETYETNKSKIEKEVRSMRLGYNQTIDWNKVNLMIENSIDWNAVVTLILRVIPQKNIEKIKQVNNQTKIIDYKNLVTFVLRKLNYSQKSKVKYICFWEVSFDRNDFDFSQNAWWIIGLIGFFVGISFGGVGGAIVFSLIAAAIAYLLNKK